MLGKIWIAGADGNIGGELKRALKRSGKKVITTDTDVDVTNMEEVNRYAVIGRPDVIINCACLSDIEECERDMVKAYKINALGARNLSAAARQIGAVIVQLSTDDVFKGSEDGTLTEFDKTEPISIYGKSKLAGENFARELNPKHIIVRSTWIYGYNNNDYVSKVINSARNGVVLEAPVNQLGSPTSADALAGFIAKVIESDEYGVFHASCEGACSRFAYAKKILEITGLTSQYLRPTMYGANSTELMRPRQARLENLMMKMTEIYEMPSWEEALERHLAERNDLFDNRQ